MALRIVVCIKRVPDTETRVRVGPDGKSIDPTGVQYVISPYDEMALERAIQLREAGAAEDVRVVCLGPAEAAKELRQALAMGADRAVLLKDARSDRDAASTAAALAAALREHEFDLLMFGNKAVDSDGAQVGVRTARRLALPVVTYVTKIDVEDGRLVLHREVEGGIEVLEAPLPCAVTAQKGLAEARYPSLKGIMAAKKKPLEEKPAPDAPNRTSVRAMEPPPPRKPGKIVSDPKELVRLLRDEAKVL